MMVGIGALRPHLIKYNPRLLVEKLLDGRRVLLKTCRTPVKRKR